MPSAAALLARRLGRPYLEVDGLANWALVAWERSTRQAVELSMQAIELARRHGWAEEPVTTPAYVVLGVSSLNQGRLEQAKSWLDRAERAVRPEVQPAEGITAHYARGAIKLACGREHEGLAAFRAAERLAGLLVTPHRWQGGPGRSRCTPSCGSGRPGWWNRPWPGWMNSSKRPLRCAASWGAATRSGSPTGRGRCARARRQRSLPVGNHRTGLVQAFLLEAITRDALGDAQAAARALERTLEIAEPDGVLFPFLLHPASGLLDRHRRTRKAIPCIMPGRQTA
jgi:LuxR family maltose regulon positive regulatory protein